MFLSASNRCCVGFSVTRSADFPGEVLGISQRSLDEHARPVEMARRLIYGFGFLVHGKDFIAGCGLPKRGQSGLPSPLQPHASGSQEPSARGEEFRSLCSGGRDGLLPPAGNGPIGRGTRARPGLGALVVDKLPGEGRLPRLS